MNQHVLNLGDFPLSRLRERVRERVREGDAGFAKTPHPNPLPKGEGAMDRSDYLDRQPVRASHHEKHHRD